MLSRSLQRPRKAAHMVEAAVVYPITFFILLGLVVGSMGIFRYQEMAALWREGSRYASVHGAQYRKDAGQPIGTGGTSASNPLGSGAPYNVAPWTTLIWFTTHPTEASGTYPNSWADDTYDNSIRPKLFLLDPARLNVYLGWTPVINQTTLPDNYPGSRVTLNVQYPVMPEWVWNIGNQSVSTAPMPITN